MKLPHLLLNSPFFVFSNESEFLRAVTGEITDAEIADVRHLIARGLPPVTSRSTLAAMLGVSPSLIWSFVAKNSRHYRTFSIRTGAKLRPIQAPKVALKVVQKWLSVQLERAYTPPEHVYGFVQGRSHIHAAMEHSGAAWVFSVDIANFFPSTPSQLVSDAMAALGYQSEGAALLSSLCCYNGFLSQGAPSSPILSNLCFSGMDTALIAMKEKYDVCLTRYADDIVFSGKSNFPEALMTDVIALFQLSPWTLAEQKTELSFAPKDQLKVHGLLVHGERVRLTKRYRNRLRGFRHSLTESKVRPDDINRLMGHVNYADMVERIVNPDPKKDA